LLGLCCTFVCVSLLLAGAGAAQTFFTEVTEEAMSWISTPMDFHGIACADYDNDGRPDLFADELFGNDRIVLLHNEGNRGFANRTHDIKANISPRTKGMGTLFGDYDNDGDPDLFVPVGHAYWNARGRDALLCNDRGVFTDVTVEAGLTDTLPTNSAIWLDYDRDGYLDLFRGSALNNMKDMNAYEAAGGVGFGRLYRNQGEGTFTNVTTEVGLNVVVQGAEGIEAIVGIGPLLAGDFSGDGWPDLYLGMYKIPNVFFLNDGQGGFQEATTSEIAHPGHPDGIAAGDIDNDGDLDLLLVNSIWIGQDRSVMYLNRGEGRFLDVTESVGLSGLTGLGLVSPALLDIDNDGDLDLFAAIYQGARLLYLNQGDGTFVDATSQTGLGSERGIGFFACWLDYDLDGFLDVAFSNRTLYRNLGNDHHWLRVKLVGVESNRNGIGARVMATSGDLRQIREVFGGDGYSQDEMVVHFGLGQRTEVAQLEIRWPSGQVDMLTDIPADQKIRIIEGRGEYHVVQPTVWESLSDSLVAGSTVHFKAAVRPALFEAEAEIIRVTADLSELGGPASVPFSEVGDGTYRLEPVRLSVGDSTGFRSISVRIDQQTALGAYWTKLSGRIAILPVADQVILDEGISRDWQVDTHKVEYLDLDQSDVVYAEGSACAVRPEESLAGWRIGFQPADPVEPIGYALRFAIHPGDVVPSGSVRFTVGVFPGSAFVNLLEENRVDLEKKVWQVVEIPLFKAAGPITSINFAGNFEGTFYLDDIRLVAATPPPSATAVLEEQTATLPHSFTLFQNYPNPFNSSTVICFALPESENVELAIYNLAGQQVTTLVSGTREAGTYTVRWDGRDEDGQELASGVYLYRLRTGDGKQVETRKLLLLR